MSTPTSTPSSTSPSSPSLFAPSPELGLAAKIGVALLLLWGVLHLWVGAEGARVYATSDANALWSMLTGGPHAPRAAWQAVTDAMTARVQANLLLNFCLDVGAAGALGLLLAWHLWRTGSWFAYACALVVIGIIDNAFLFTQVLPGHIEGNAGTWGGPILWALAMVLIPFGMKRSKKTGA